MSVDKKLRVGLIGTGGISPAHTKPWKELGDRVEIVAACDLREERARKTAAFFDGKPQVFTDYKAMLDSVPLDAVDICTPNCLHSVMAVEALDRGIHVLCEKPDAIDVEKVEQMKAAADRSGKTLMVMRNNRFRAAAQYMKAYIEQGKAGELYAGRCGWVRRRGTPGWGSWFTNKEESGGGPLIDLGVHMIDLAIWLMGNPRPVSVSGSTYLKFSDNDAPRDSVHSQFGDANPDGKFDVEDLAMGFIKFDNGACLQIEFSWASNVEKERNFVELRGTKAGFTLDDDLTIFTEDNNTLVDIQPQCHSPWGGHDGYIRHFVDVVTKGVRPCFVPQQGVDMIKILCAIYESAETGREVLL